MASGVVRTAQRRLVVSTELASEEVKLVGFTGTEGISRPYRYELKLRVGLDDFDPSTTVCFDAMEAVC
jgi:uncharacterized protein involved in type VI secretion and phage assembly